MEELKKGYKKTKVGVIPEDWEVKRLGDIFNIVTGGTPLRNKQEYWQNVSIPWVKTMDLNNFLIVQTDEMISEEGLKNSSCKLLPKNTLLVAMYGGFNQIGRTGILKIEATTNQAISALIKKVPLNESFVNYILILFRDKWKKFAISSRKDPNITKKDIENFIIPFPPLKEQEKIAKILSTWDKAIELQEELIKEKEKLKTALMQKLLRGKVRFKEFSEEWEEVKLGDIGEFKTSSVDKKIREDEQQVKLLNYMDVYKNNKIDSNYKNFQKITATEQQIKTNNLIKGDIVFTPSSETPNDIGRSAVILEDLEYTLYSYHLVRFRLKSDMDLEFRGYVFNNSLILKEFAKRATGITRFTLSIKDLALVNFKISKGILKYEYKAI